MLNDVNSLPDLKELQLADAEKVAVLIVPEIENLKFEFNEHFRIRMYLINSVMRSIKKASNEKKEKKTSQNTV